jgi:outer membrane murein-binding lipoprotein Lpp
MRSEDRLTTYKLMIVATSIVAGLCALVGCSDSERLAKLEKQNQELQAQIKKQESASALYDLQAKCAKDAAAWFRTNFPADKDTILLNQTNHYNRSMNKCFISVEYHFSTSSVSWSNAMSLWDVQENSQYAEYREGHWNSWVGDKLQSSDRLDECYASTTKCKSIQEFNSSVHPYMND